MALISCPNCGAPQLKTYKVCTNCGCLLPHKPQYNKKKSKLPIIILILISVYIIVILFSSPENNNNSSETTSVVESTNTIIEKEKKHKYGKWKVLKTATFDKKGQKQRICKECDYIDKKEYELSKKEKKKYLINNCASYTYEEIARNPDKHKGKYAKLSGEVIQIIEYSKETILRVDITLDEYGFYSDTIYAIYNKSNSGDGRILEDDIITLYGILDGMESYTSVLGSEINLPRIKAYYIEIKN